LLVDVVYSDRVLECSFRVVVIPIGSVEYHGGALPYGADSIIADRLARRCLTGLEYPETCLYLYPVIPYGYSPEWLDYPGSVSLTERVFVELLASILDSLEDNLDPDGYIILNAHGGNTGLLEALAREAYMSIAKPVFIVDVWRIAGIRGLKYCHACPFEAQLYNYLTGENRSGVNSVFCRDEELRGGFIDYEPGYCGEVNTGVEEFVKTICDSVRKAVAAITGRERGL